MNFKQLTSAEEQVIQILWKLQEAVVKDILDQFPEPRPAYNTVSTVVRVLEKKGFVGHKAYGNTHLYRPLISEADYKSFSFNKVFANYFSKSYANLFSFLVEENNLTEAEIEEIRHLVNKLKTEKK